MSTEKLKFVVHHSADVQTVHIGEKTTIWQYCVILSGAKIGSNVNICSHCFLENHVTIGNNCTIKNGVNIFDGTVIEDDVFIGPSVCFTNDKYPKSKIYMDEIPTITICKGASIGAGSIILPGVTIGAYSLIGAGSVITKDVPAHTTVFGNPARIMVR